MVLGPEELEEQEVQQSDLTAAERRRHKSLMAVVGVPVLVSHQHGLRKAAALPEN